MIKGIISLIFLLLFIADNNILLAATCIDAEILPKDELMSIPYELEDKSSCFQCLLSASITIFNSQDDKFNFYISSDNLIVNPGTCFVPSVVSYFTEFSHKEECIKITLSWIDVTKLEPFDEIGFGGYLMKSFDCYLKLKTFMLSIPALKNSFELADKGANIAYNADDLIYISKCYKTLVFDELLCDDEASFLVASPRRLYAAGNFINAYFSEKNSGKSYLDGVIQNSDQINLSDSFFSISDYSNDALTNKFFQKDDSCPEILNDYKTNTPSPDNLLKSAVSLNKELNSALIDYLVKNDVISDLEELENIQLNYRHTSISGIFDTTYQHTYDLNNNKIKSDTLNVFKNLCALVFLSSFVIDEKSSDKNSFLEYLDIAGRNTNLLHRAIMLEKANAAASYRE